MSRNRWKTSSRDGSSNSGHRRAPFPVPRRILAGVRIDYPTFAQAVVWARERVVSRTGGYVCHVSGHGVVEAQEDASLAAALAGSALALPDGMPLVWMGRRHGLKAERVYGPDFMRALLAVGMDAGGRTLRHFLFGSTPQVLAMLEARIREEYPRALIVGSLSPPFGPVSEEEGRAHLEAILSSGADVVWVGLGAPRQEKWMAEASGRLPGILLFGVGAAFDFLAGTKRQAPAFLRGIGLEWAFRWLSEPRRLTGRYRRIVPGLLRLMIRDALDRPDT
ncbi:MAG: WecB/TagA/CpsF family glycosyltransferase [Alphaproteobacteria bacterium]